MSGSSLSFCMVTTFYPPHNFGGDGIYVHRLSNELARRGHRVTVVSAPDAHELLGWDRGCCAGRARERDARADRAAAWAESRRSSPTSPVVRDCGRAQLGELFAREQFDVIHFHNVSLVGGPGVLAYGEGVKLYTTHEHWLVCPMHTLWRNNREPCLEPKCLRCTLAFRRPPQLWRYGSLLERELRRVDLFLAPSRFTIGMHRERGFAGPMRHLPPFTPPDNEEAVDGESPERPYFLVVGRLERLKGVQTLIELFRRYDAADLVVVGAGTYGEELRRQAAGLEHVRFTGALPFKALRSLYKDALAVLAPSVGYETFGMTTIEAFARRTPAIVRDLGGLPETVQESGAGFVYREDAELLEAMESLRNSRTLRDELGERGHRAYLERWAPEPHLRAYFDLIDEARAARERRAFRPKGTLSLR